MPQNSISLWVLHHRTKRIRDMKCLLYEMQSSNYGVDLLREKWSIYYLNNTLTETEQAME